MILGIPSTCEYLANYLENSQEIAVSGADSSSYNLRHKVLLLRDRVQVWLLLLGEFIPNNKLLFPLERSEKNVGFRILSLNYLNIRSNIWR